MPSRAELKKMARRAVHSAFAVPILFYKKNAAGPVILENGLTARLHNKVIADADMTGAGGSVILDNNTRVVFNVEELAVAAVKPESGDRVSFLDYGVIVTLGIKDTFSGVIVQKWTAQPSGTVAQR